MTIVCGTDFSVLAARATEVAGRIAKAAGEPLCLVHAKPAGIPGEGSPEGVIRSRLADAIRQLDALGIAITGVVVEGEPDEVIVSQASLQQARLIVIGAVGHRRLDRWLLGSCADRTAREATVPVLVVRNEHPFGEWLSGQQPLRIAVGFDAGPSSRAALEWAGWLARLAPTRLLLLRLVTPGTENRLVGASGPGMGLNLLPETEIRLTEDLRKEGTALLGGLPFEIQVSTALGRVDQRLVAAAEEQAIDLIIVGSNQREGFERWWHGSVSSGVLHAAPMSVATVPLEPVSTSRSG